MRMCQCGLRDIQSSRSRVRPPSQCTAQLLLRCVNSPWDMSDRPVGRRGGGSKGLPGYEYVATADDVANVCRVVPVCSRLQCTCLLRYLTATTTGRLTCGA